MLVPTVTFDVAIVYNHKNPTRQSKTRSNPPYSELWKLSQPHGDLFPFNNIWCEINSQHCMKYFSHSPSSPSLRELWNPLKMTHTFPQRNTIEFCIQNQMQENVSNTIDKFHSFFLLATFQYIKNEWVVKLVFPLSPDAFHHKNSIKFTSKSHLLIFSDIFFTVLQSYQYCAHNLAKLKINYTWN